MKRHFSLSALFLLATLIFCSSASAAAAPCGINHQKVSAVSDSADTTIIRPSDWNADHNCDANAFGPTEIDETANYTWSGTQNFSSATLTLPSSISSATVIATTVFRFPRVTAFPGSPTAGDTVTVTDDSAIGACDSNAGAATTTCQWSGAAWVAIGDGSPAEADTLDTVFDRGKTIDGANSLANAVRIGDGTTPWCIYTDATLGPQLRPCTDANVRTIIPTNFTWCSYDIEGDTCIETIDPDAASTLAVWTYGAAYRPKKSIWFGAGSLSTDGTQCAAPAEVTINSGPKIWTIICAENDASTIYGSVRMPDSWDAGTVTFTHVYIQTAADTGSMFGELSAQCRGNGEAPSSTWGTVVELDDAAVTGSNQNDMITSTAVTPAGTCAAGDMLYWQWQYDATANPTTAAATLNHVGFNIEYSVTSRSD